MTRAVADTVTSQPAWMPRFLAPAHVADDYVIDQWQYVGVADTPGEDARCRLWLQLEQGLRVQARFALFGPPVAVAAADWLCEQINDQTFNDARGITSRDVETALALSPTERYAALLVTDALINALANTPANLGT